jgi:hypothetical protein
MNFKTLIIGLLCFISTAAYGQHDFDYTIFTKNHSTVNEEDSLRNLTNLSLFRKFTKVGSELRMTNIFSSGNETTYQIEFVGFPVESENRVLAYIVTSIDGVKENDMYVFINPINAEVIFRKPGYTSFYD